MSRYAKMHGSDRLTEKQLRAVIYALGNSMDHPDVVESLFPDPRERKAAMDGYFKLKVASWRFN